ncbi:MAG: DUF2442 domain-containing protein [Cyanobacteriota bacterium]
MDSPGLHKAPAAPPYGPGPPVRGSVSDVARTEGRLLVDHAVGHSISVPSASYARLPHATPRERDSWDSAGADLGIHWPDIDEELSPASSEPFAKPRPHPR